MDAGAVCDVEKIVIDDSDTSVSLRQKFCESSAILLERNLNSIKNKTANFVEQDDAQATYTRKFQDLISKYGVKIVDTRKNTPNFRLFEKGEITISSFFYLKYVNYHKMTEGLF